MRREKGDVVPGGQTRAPETPKAGDAGEYAVRSSTDSITDFYKAYVALKDEGWQDAIYAPKDGTEIEIIEVGSTGIHKVAWSSFDHQPLDTCGCFFGGAEGYPSHPVLWRRVPATPNE